MKGREKSDDRIVPKGRRKAAPTRPGAGGKAITVRKDEAQLSLFEGSAVRPMPSTTPLSAPSTIQMEEVVEDTNMRTAFQNVFRNRGAPGPDGQSVHDVRARLESVLPRVRKQLLEGTYRVGAIRRVWIPKPNGKKRALGIPNVIDRWVAQCLLQKLSPIYEGEFHPSSHGFRPGRSCHTALEEAREHLSNDHHHVVDIDLEDFFNRVHHQRLIARLGRRIRDHRILRLIQDMLQTQIVLPEGVRVRMEEGTPQGGPLSPLLSNLVLDELDQELHRRGHRFVRYADDLRIFVRTPRSGERVMASVRSFIERRLRLSVNREKSRVVHARQSSFLGFSFILNRGGRIRVQVSREALERLRQRIRQLTPRTWGRSLKDCIEQLNQFLRGWQGYYAYADPIKWTNWGTIDSHIRRRLRAICLRQWKRKRSIARRLIKLGVPRGKAWSIYRGSRSWWALAISGPVHQGLSNAYFEQMGVYSLQRQYRPVRRQVLDRLRPV